MSKIYFRERANIPVLKWFCAKVLLIITYSTDFIF